MARYRFTQDDAPHSTVSLRFGSFSDFRLIRVDDVQNYSYDGEVYTITRLLCNFEYFYKGPTWDTANGYPLGRWTSGALSVEIRADSTGINLGRFGVGNTTSGNYTGYNGSYNGGVGVLWGEYDGQEGALFIVDRGEYSSEGYSSYESGYFVPNEVLALGDIENPYSPDGTEYPDGTPDGGYGSGTANKGDATAGTVPTHPIVSGRGVHYMLVNDAQLADFSDHMWGRGTGVFETLWQKWENYKFNPMAGVLTCHALPTAFYPAVAGAASSISIAGTSVPVSCTSVAIGIVEQVYTESLADILQYGSFLDFDYLQIFAHIPFCGICEIPPSACIGGSVKFIYRCDILTGNVACWVCTTDRFGATHQINCLTGNCAYIVPITGNDNGMSAIIGALSSNLTAMVGSFEKGAQAFATGGSPRAGGVSAAGSTANALRMATAQKHTTVAGNVSGSVAILSNMHLFLDITYANPSYPSTMLDVRGTPSDRGGSVGTFSGTYTEFSDVHADGIPGATEEEKRMIETALKQGVFV